MAQHVAAPAESRLPESVGNEYDAGRAFSFVGRLEVASEDRRDAEHRADAAEDEARRYAEWQRLRTQDDTAEGAGHLTDRTARLALRDAAEIRADAVRAARELLDLARTEAEDIRKGL